MPCLHGGMGRTTLNCQEISLKPYWIVSSNLQNRIIEFWYPFKFLITISQKIISCSLLPDLHASNNSSLLSGTIVLSSSIDVVLTLSIEIVDLYDNSSNNFFHIQTSRDTRVGINSIFFNSIPIPLFSIPIPIPLLTISFNSNSNSNSGNFNSNSNSGDFKSNLDSRNGLLSFPWNWL